MNTLVHLHRALGLATPYTWPLKRTWIERLFKYRCAIRGWLSIHFRGGEYPLIHNWGVGGVCRDCGDGENR